MQIDWITVSAQIINFLVLVWLLKRFLYQPVVRAMDQREQRITQRLKEAQQRERRADERAERYQEQTEDLERTRNDILAKAREDADEQKKKLLAEARDEVAEIRAYWKRQANQEKQEFLSNLARRAVEAIQTIARKALRDLADADLEERIAHTLTERLKSMDMEARRALAQTSEPVRIASTFALDPKVRSRLTRAIHEYLAEGVEVDYMQAEGLLCGIELTSGSQRVSWSLAEYLDELTARVEDAFSPTEFAKEGD